LILIEDCAHSLGAVYNGKSVGTFGKVSFFSFSRDKVISSVYGGMVATNDSSLAEKIRQAQNRFDYPSRFWIKQQLLHPVLMNWLILPTYKFFGKYFFVLFQELNILSKAVVLKEKIGEKPAYFPKRMPNALAILALNQLKKTDRFNQYRKGIAAFYAKELSNTSYKLPDTSYNGNIFLRFTVKHPKAHEIIGKAWKNNILIGDWYTTPIAPDYNKLEKIKYGKNLRSVPENAGYKTGSCPIAEKLAKETIDKTDDIAYNMQQQSLYMMPIMSLVIGITLPAGVVLYIVTTTIFSIIQTYLISGLGGVNSWIKKLKSVIVRP
jgi:dTDP-4-amino-4,6-dideoxygalactose transaminase